MRRVVVSVGTDHHPFDRLIGGVQEWVTGWPDAELVVQHGYSAPAAGATNHDFIPREELLSLFRDADLLVTQVGPGTILDANLVGRRPVAMPRDPSRGEHVDWHQFAFAKAMRERDSIHLAHSIEDLHAALAAAEADPQSTRMPLRVSPADETAARLGSMAETLMTRPARLVYWSRIVPSLARLAGPAALTDGRARQQTKRTRDFQNGNGP